MQDNPHAAPKSTTSSSADDPRAVSIIISCEAVIFDYEELRTLAALAKAGLTPGLRHQRSA
jgi:hypothetical protein